nr:hypothetical protein [Thermoanaerobaculia bacterium]
MNPELYAQADALFAHLLELADEERRPAFEAACGDNDALREAVAQLLRADARSACFLDVPAAPRLAALEDGTGGLFGPYRPIELLGEGGMGRVYLARRDDDLYQRKVAIKVLSGPWQSPAALERFRAERR